MRIPTGLRLESTRTPNASRAGALHSHIHIHNQRHRHSHKPRGSVQIQVTFCDARARRFGLGAAR